jgi:hypothetical protein
VHGNFLLDGEHWATVRARLPQPMVKRSPSPARSELPQGRRVLTELPAAASEAQRAAALAASARIRHERTLDFGQAVVLRLPDRSVRFSPISEHAQAVEVRFTYDHRGETLSGALRLRSTHDPLALALTRDVPAEQLVAAAWSRRYSATQNSRAFPRQSALTMSSPRRATGGSNVPGRPPPAPSPCTPLTQRGGEPGPSFRHRLSRQAKHRRGSPPSSSGTGDFCRLAGSRARTPGAERRPSGSRSRSERRGCDRTRGAYRPTANLSSLGG